MTVLEDADRDTNFVAIFRRLVYRKKMTMEIMEMATTLAATTAITIVNWEFDIDGVWIGFAGGVEGVVL